MKNLDITQKLEVLRKEMSEEAIDLYLVPSSDSHNSEYVADFWEVRSWISGFTGSAGLAVIGHNFAHLWTDGRYFTQAELELKDSEFELMKIDNNSNFNKWLKENISHFKKVGANAEQYSITEIERIIKLSKEHKISYDFSKDLIANIWTDRKSLKTNDIFSHDIKYAGESRASKLNVIKKELAKEGIENYLVSQLDSIAWVLNLRGSDISYNPVFYSYLIIGKVDTYLFIDENKISKNLREELEKDNITLKSYNSFYEFLASFKNELTLNENNTNYKVAKSLKSFKNLNKNCPIVKDKARKNKIEVGNLKEALKNDSIALINFFMWLDNNLDRVSEYEASEKLSYFRSKGEGYKSDSFQAIVGFRGNGAIIHYAPDKNKSSIIESKGMLLLDSGGQYLNGTTDITRTVYFGDPSKEEREDYTLVLKGHIALASAKFLKGTSGEELDILARQFLLNNNKNYGHGTGHGVGYFLNVHEGPQGISPRRGTKEKVSLEKGMLISNEPGFYKESKYGIRLENLILVTENIKNEFGEFLEFETLTLFPFENKLIDKTLLTSEEILWINDYHQKVLENLSDTLNKDQLKWLKVKASYI